MQKMFVGSAALVGLVLCTAAASADPATTSATPAATPDPGDRIVCKTLPPKTGSRIGARRECRSQKEWDEEQQRQQKETSDMETRSLTLSPGPH